jgi:dTDP-4-amino-4,6-dideoxygalactose transaminase
VLASGWIAEGTETEALERELGERFGCEVVVVSSGTAALYLALMMVSGGSIHIDTTACTSLVHAAVMAAVSLVLHDYRNALGVYGIESDFAGRQRTDGSIIQDVTQTLSPRAGHLIVGSMGPAKLINTPGLGFVAGFTSLEEVRRLKRYDSTPPQAGRFNWTANDIAAAMARTQLARLDENLERRREIAETYCAAANQSMPTDERSWFRFCVETADAEASARWFAERGIKAIVPVRREELLHVLLGDSRSYPKAEHIAQTWVSLPIGPWMTQDEVAAVSVALREFASEQEVQVV